jgi:hypothetical protein
LAVFREVVSFLARAAYASTYVVKVKVRFTLEQATKAQRGSKGIALLFL